MAEIPKFNSIIKSNSLDILRLGEINFYPKTKLLEPLKQDLAEFASKKDFFTFGESLQKELLSKTVSKENFIAKGAQGKVYRIPGTDCAVKVPLDCVSIPIKPISKNISPQEKVNLVLAKIGDDINIIKYVDGKNPYQLSRRGVSVPKTVLSLPHEAFTNYIEKISEASKLNMFHDIAGANTLINEKYRYIVPIDFYHSLTKKANPVEDLYFQFGNYLKNSKEQDLFLAKSSLAFVDLIRTNKINAKNLAKMDVSLKKLQDCFLPENRRFFSEVEYRLKKITGLKKMESLSLEMSQSLQEEIVKFNDFITSVLTNV